jgi:hypothetical protein
VNRITRIMSMSTLGVAVVAGACAATAWSQAVTNPAPAAPAAATTHSEPQQAQAQSPGDRDGRGDGRGEFRDMRERRPGGGGGGDDMRTRGGVGPGGGGGGGEWRRDNFADPDTDEWDKIKAFMKQHSPERLNRLEEIGDEKRQEAVRNMFAARYRMLQEVKERDPELYDIRLKRLPVEDKAFELSWRLMRKQAEKPEEARKQLRAQLRELVKSRLQERAVHLRHMEQRLKLEEQRMQAEEQRIEETVEANLSDLAEERLPRDLRPPQFGRRDRRDDDSPGGAVPASPAQP